MSQITIGTLGPDGWVSTPMKKFEYAIGHFFASEYSQTHLFKGSISSLPWVVQESQGNMQDFCTLLEKTLISYLNTMFQNTVVEAVEVPTDTQFKGEARLYVQVTDYDGTELNLGKVIHTENGLIREIIDIVNT